MDQLKAEETGQTSPRTNKRNRDKKKERSPLRRAYSSYDGTADSPPSNDSGDDILGI
jgi:hypothetical protein